MKYLIYGHRATASLAELLWRLVRRAWPAGRPQTEGRPHGAGGRHEFGRRLVPLLLPLGLVCQLVLLFLLGQLVDLCISLMEVWLELAQKHMEITLSV